MFTKSKWICNVKKKKKSRYTKKKRKKKKEMTNAFKTGQIISKQKLKQQRITTHTSLEVVYTLSKIDSGAIHFTGNNPVVFFK